MGPMDRYPRYRYAYQVYYASPGNSHHVTHTNTPHSQDLCAETKPRAKWSINTINPSNFTKTSQTSSIASEKQAQPSQPFRAQKRQGCMSSLYGDSYVCAPYVFRCSARQALSLLLVPSQSSDEPSKPAIEFFDQAEIYPGALN